MRHETANPAPNAPFRRKRLSIIILTGVLIALIAAASVFMVACSNQGSGSNVTAVNPTVKVDEGVALPQFNAEVLLCSQQAKQVFDHELTITDAVLSGEPYRPFVFEYLLEKDSGILLLSEDVSLANAQEFCLDKEKTSVSIDNLKTGTTYYYQVEVAGKQYSGSFHTASANRFISVPGVENLRDIGGYKTLDGKTVKQGLLIRGCELDGLQNADYFVSAQDIAAMQEIFGFVYDLDLRSSDIFEGEYQSALGNQVRHKFYDSPSYAQIFRPEYLDSMREIFADLADPNNYPMYLHCTWGRDRTGTIVLLLQGLLNVSEEDILQEYRLTGFVKASIASSNKMDPLLLQLNTYKGNTLQEKIIDYLTTTVGVTPEEIASIQSIFLD